MKSRIVKPCLLFLFFPVLIPSSITASQRIQLSGGMDGRYNNIDWEGDRLVLEGLFFNLRKVFSDQKGDRVILVGQLDMDENFDKVRPYQTYLQYKGGMGRWNLRFGHYILPFGLLSDYDTERLLIKTLEPLSLGIKLDTGLELFGYWDEFDYALSISQGMGRNRLTDTDNDKLVVARVGWKNLDQTLGIGFSVLIGKVRWEEDSDLDRVSLYERRLGVDISGYWGPLTLQGEVVIGKDADKDLGGGFLGADYALSPKLEFNFKYAYWQRGEERNFIGMGLSYRLHQGLYLRIGDNYQFGREDENTFSIQVYYEFSKAL